MSSLFTRVNSRSCVVWLDMAYSVAGGGLFGGNTWLNQIWFKQKNTHYFDTSSDKNKYHIPYEYNI